MARGSIIHIAMHLGFCLFGMSMVYLSQNFEQTGSITPVFIGFCIIALTLVSLLSVVLNSAKTFQMKSTGGSIWRSLAFIILVTLWITLLPYLGFIFSGCLFFTLISFAVPTDKSKVTKQFMAVSVGGYITTFAFWVVLTKLLHIPLPEATISLLNNANF